MSSPERTTQEQRTLIDAHERLRQALESTIQTLWHHRTEFYDRVTARTTGETVTLSLEELTSTFDESSVVPYHPASGTVGGIQTDEIWLAPPDSIPPTARDSGARWLGAFPRELGATLRAVLPSRTEQLSDAVENYRQSLSAVRQANTVTPLVDAIGNGRAGIAATLLNVDPSTVRLASSEDETETATDDSVDRPPAVRLLTSIVDTIPFAARDLAVVRTPANGRHESEAYVVGTDDTPTGLFVHPVDGTELHPRTNLTRDDINSAMGFDRATPEQDLKPDVDERIRLQGDLRVRKTRQRAMAAVAGYASQTDDSVGLNQVAKKFLRYASRAATAVPDVSVWVSNLSDSTRQLQVRTSVSADALSSVHRDTLLTAVVTLLAESESVPVSLDDTLYDGGPQRLRLYRAIADSPLTDSPLTVHPSAVLIRPPDRILTQSLLEQALVVAFEHGHEVILDELLLKLSLNLVTVPLDNHLVAIEAGVVLGDREHAPVRVAVPRPSHIEVGHDEHETVSLAVAPGLYEFDFLPRSLETEPLS